MDADFLQPHLPALLQPIAVAPAKPIRGQGGASGKGSQAAKTTLGLQLWAAMDRGQLAAVEAALEAGADVDFTRQKTTPLWAAVQVQRLDIAAALLARGADPARRGPRGESLFGALLSRNDPQEAQALLNLLDGALPTVTATEFLSARAYDLLAWFLALPQQTTAWIPRAASIQTSLEYAPYTYHDWCKALVRAPELLECFFQQAWGTAQNDPGYLTRTLSVFFLQRLWEEIALRDDVALAQRFVAQGWGPPPAHPLPEKNHKQANRLDARWEFGLGWVLLGKRAWQLLAWWTAVPELAQDMQTWAQQRAKATLHTLTFDLPTLERLHALHIDLGQVDDHGQLLAHRVFASGEASQALFTWWCTHRPQDLEVRNAQERRPLEPLKPKKPAIVAKLRQTWLQHQLPPSTAGTATRTRF